MTGTNIEKEHLLEKASLANPLPGPQLF